MCLLFCCRNAHPDFPLIVLANRDEFYERPTRAAAFWTDAPDVLAGRDLRHGGTWLGATRTGRWAALTNYRDPSDAVFSRSRGEIVKDYLSGGESAGEFARRTRRAGDEFDGFNLVLGDRRESLWFSNRGDGAIHALENGIYGLSNHLLETPWPKVTRGKERLRVRLEKEPVVDRLLEPLVDRTVFEDGLPDTGVGRELEKMLSSAFISGERYGTRCSTLIMLDRHDRLYFEERSYANPTGGPKKPDEYSSKIYSFKLD